MLSKSYRVVPGPCHVLGRVVGCTFNSLFAEVYKVVALVDQGQLKVCGQISYNAFNLNARPRLRCTASAATWLTSLNESLEAVYLTRSTFTRSP